MQATARNISPSARFIVLPYHVLPLRNLAIEFGGYAPPLSPLVGVIRNQAVAAADYFHSVAFGRAAFYVEENHTGLYTENLVVGRLFRLQRALS